MSKVYVNLPSEQAVWTRADVEKYLSEKGPEVAFGRDALQAWADKQNLIPAGTAPAVVRMPAAVVPELAALTDPTNDRRDTASVYVDGRTAEMFATDAKVMMRVAVNDVRAKQDAVGKDIGSVIPKADGRTPFRYDAHVLLRLVLSALASTGGDPTRQKSGAKITFWPHPTDTTGIVRVEVSTDENEVRMVGAVMPMRMDDDYPPLTDPRGLRRELAPSEANAVGQTLLDDQPTEKPGRQFSDI